MAGCNNCGGRGLLPADVKKGDFDWDIDNVDISKIGYCGECEGTGVRVDRKQGRIVKVERKKAIKGSKLKM